MGGGLLAAALMDEEIQKYKNRLSGPILDRIDMHLEIFESVYEKKSPENILDLEV